MTTRTMLAILFIVTILAILAGIGYSIATGAPQAAFFSVFVGGFALIFIVGVNNELK